jgi:hypothetical protein
MKTLVFCKLVDVRRITSSASRLPLSSTLGISYVTSSSTSRLTVGTTLLGLVEEVVVFDRPDRVLCSLSWRLPLPIAVGAFRLSLVTKVGSTCIRVECWHPIGENYMRVWAGSFVGNEETLSGNASFFRSRLHWRF